MARGDVLARDLAQGEIVGPTPILDPEPRSLTRGDEWAARVEPAAGRHASRVRRLALQDELLHLLDLGNDREERACVRVARVREELLVACVEVVEKAGAKLAIPTRQLIAPSPNGASAAPGTTHAGSVGGSS